MILYLLLIFLRFSAAARKANFDVRYIKLICCAVSVTVRVVIQLALAAADEREQFLE
jgi:hypothetical protein